MTHGSAQGARTQATRGDRAALYRDIPEDLRRLIEPVIEDHGCELVDVAVQRGGGPGLLRITIDTPMGDGQIPVEQLARVSRELGTQLDAADAMPGAYQLELTSPGLDRVLAREKDFKAACGRTVRIMTRRPMDGRRRFRGTLVDFEDGTVLLTVGEDQLRIPFAEIAKANAIYEFSREDFRGTANQAR